MSADDQTFLDALSSVPNDIRKYSNDVADYLDRHLERASVALREGLSSASWLPESARPRALPPPPRAYPRNIIPPPSFYTRAHDWIASHKVLTSFIIIAIGGVTYHIVKRSIPRKKRRAKKASNGARLEVVVIAGSPSEPLVRSISLDLERRGFIVYIVCNTIEEEVLVQNESRQDIRPLMIDIIDPGYAQAAIERFTAHLQTPHAAFQGAKPHHLTLRSLILIPSTTYPTTPIATLAGSTLNDLLNTRLLTPILTLQTFLPLLTSLPFNHPHHQPTTSSTSKPSILLLTPSIIPSLTPAFHAAESTLISGLTAFTSVLRAELSPLSLPVTQIHFGTFDLSPISPQIHNHSNRALTSSSQRAETLKWDPQIRDKYARNFVAVSTTTSSAAGIGRKGSSLRELNDVVFDAMFSSRSRHVRVGLGAGLYGFVGRWVPSDLVSWMMGVRNVGDQGIWVVLAKGEWKKEKRIIEGSDEDGDGGSDGADSNSADGRTESLGESYVYPQRSDGFVNRADV